jgi:KTSC domain
MTIQAMRYDEVAQVLTVSFRGWGGTRRFFEVPPTEWAALNAVFGKAAYLQQVLAPRRRNELLRAA